MFNSIRKLMKQRFNQWLSKRIPADHSHQLTNRNTFIFPTKFGFSYFFFVLVLFLLGTNYQNNIIILFSFLFASFFITVMMHSFYNFSQLHVASQARYHCFVGQELNINLMLNSKRARYNFHANFVDQTIKSKSGSLFQCNVGSNQLTIICLPTKRGDIKLGRINIFSEYAFGLFKSWSILDFSHRAIIYPSPLPLATSQSSLSFVDNRDDTKRSFAQAREGVEDFSELRSFIPGESLSRTAWKQLAKGQGHYSKHYHVNQGEPIWLKLSEMPSVSIEKQLCFLSYLICELTLNQQKFGLLLDGGKTRNSAVRIEPDSGSRHKQNTLTTLALYQ